MKSSPSGSPIKKKVKVERLPTVFEQKPVNDQPELTPEFTTDAREFREDYAYANDDVSDDDNDVAELDASFTSEFNLSGPKKDAPSFPDDPILLKSVLNMGADITPQIQFTARNSADDLQSYYREREHLVVSECADFSRSKIIFVGTDHNSYAFYELVKGMQARGKNIIAVFHEEINSDQITIDPRQHVIDRHFVANSQEMDRLQFAHNISHHIDTEFIAQHMANEAANYMDEKTIDFHKSYFSDYLKYLGANNIRLGGIDQTKYRDKPTSGYNYHRHSQMNYHAAKIIKSFVEKNQALLSVENNVILVSMGNAHGVNFYETIDIPDTQKIGIRSIPDLVQLELLESTILTSGLQLCPISSISTIVNKHTYNQYQAAIQISGSSLIPYDRQTRVTRSDSDDGLLYSSKYLLLGKNDRELCDSIGSILDRSLPAIKGSSQGH
ncbi:MAG: hypothetical protein HOM96_03010 [Rickettsiales bacterium]|jgi:hypothetical protein|nr:hypothetical protein [Rickettsiales bacterium]